ncbi:hypothetical protein EJ07DRAFT_95911 [Lizonia empirigonia]|nr:hypothetical protein EJ07DRAFT_95911 [Lizonia empirigonia]
MSSKDNLALDLEHGVRRWDRQRWISVFSSHSPTIREVTECLGLGLSASSSTTNRGIPKFDNPDYRKISSEVTKLSKELPKERDALLDFAADPHSLDTELEELLGTYGPAIWGKDADRSFLLTPDPSKKTYNKDLFFEYADHKEILKIHLHRWIIIKACYYIRNMKLKRPSNANDYDTLADIEGDGGSQRGTPQSLSPPHADTPAGAELDVKPNLKKRKSSAYLGGLVSDGEEHPPSPAKRPYSSLPRERRSPSPRKSLKLFGAAGPRSAENTPHLPVRPFDQNHHLSPPPSAGPETARLRLSPLSSNEVNGISGPPASAPTPVGGFTALNNGSFTAVNTPPAPPIREPSTEAPRSRSLDAKTTSPSRARLEPRAYTSPYDTAANGVNLPPVAPDPRSVSALHAASVPGQGFHTTNSPTPTNGVVSRESSVARAAQHSQAAPQAASQLSQHTHSSPQSQAAQVKARSESVPQSYTPSKSHVQLHQQQAAAQPPSRTQTPNSQHVGRSIAPHPSSRSNTPFAQDANVQPIKAHNQHIAPAPAHAPSEVHAPLHGMRIAPAHVEVVPQHAPRPVVAVMDLRLLQCEVLALLIQYLFPRAASPPDEPAVLSRIRYLWYHGEALFRSELGPHFDMCSRVLTAWLHERQAINSLRHSLVAQPGVGPAALMDRLLAMNDLRVMRLKWKNMSPLDGISPEDLLCRTFAVMSNTENTENLYKDGLDRLNRGVFEFLRHEDSKIVMHRR